MTIDEAITRCKNNAEFERTHGNLQGCLEFRQLAKWLEQLQKIEEIMEDYQRYPLDCLFYVRKVLEDGNE
jgi:hypothetical protein